MGLLLYLSACYSEKKTHFGIKRSEYYNTSESSGKLTFSKSFDIEFVCASKMQTNAGYRAVVFCKTLDTSIDFVCAASVKQPISSGPLRERQNMSRVRRANDVILTNRVIQLHSLNSRYQVQGTNCR